MELILASNNPGKIAEIRALLPQADIRTMRQAGFMNEIEEPYDTFQLNAFQKADTIWKWANTAVLADDSGLCVEALGGEPGVFSARYAGGRATDQENNQKLLQTLDGHSNRRAFYFAQLCLIVGGTSHFFEGRCDGHIAEALRGSGGFGYDPLFVPDGYDLTFAELSAEVKSRISHRGKALTALTGFLNSHAGAALIDNAV